MAKVAKTLQGLVKNPTFEELIGSGGSDISDIGLYTRQPATAYRNFFFATQADGVVVDETLDDKVSKLVAVLQAQVDLERMKTMDRQENTRQQFRDNLPRANNEPEMGTGEIPTDSDSGGGTGFDGAPPPLPPPAPPPGGPSGPVPALPLPPAPSFFNAPRRAAREQVERGRDPRPAGAPPPLNLLRRQAGPAPAEAPRVPSSSGSASTRASTRPRASTSRSSTSSGGYRNVTDAQLESRGRATIAVQQRDRRNPLNASAPPQSSSSAAAPPRGRRRRMDTPEPPRYRPYGG